MPPSLPGHALNSELIQGVAESTKHQEDWSKSTGYRQLVLYGLCVTVSTSGWPFKSLLEMGVGTCQPCSASVAVWQVLLPGRLD